MRCHGNRLDDAPLISRPEGSCAELLLFTMGLFQMWLLILTAPMGAHHFAYVTRRSLCPVPCDVTPGGYRAVGSELVAR